MSQARFEDEVTIGNIVEYSKSKIISGPDTGKFTMKRNLECMKNWSDEEISEVFNAKGQLRNFRANRTSVPIYRRKSLTENNPPARVRMVKSTRKHAIFALKMFFEEETLQDRDLKMPNGNDIRQLATKLISEENIRHKFNKSWTLSQFFSHGGRTLLSITNS